MRVWVYTGLNEASNEKATAVIVAKDQKEAANILNAELDKYHLWKTGKASNRPLVLEDEIQFLCSDVAYALIIQYGKD